MIWDLEEWWLSHQVCVFKSTYDSLPITDIFMNLCRGTFYTVSANTCSSMEGEISQPVFTQRVGVLPSYLLWKINSCREARGCIFMTHWGSGVCSRFNFRRVWNCPGIFHLLNLLHHPQESNSVIDFCLVAITLSGQSQFYSESGPSSATFSWVSFSCTESSFFPLHGFALASNPL